MFYDKHDALTVVLSKTLFSSIIKEASPKAGILKAHKVKISYNTKFLYP